MTKENLTKRRLLLLDRKIDSAMISDMIRALGYMLMEDDTRDVNIIFNCCGGNSFFALKGYDVIKSLPFRVNSYILGKCDSAAITMMSACEKRFSTFHSTFLFHHMGFEVNFKPADHENPEVYLKNRLAFYSQSFENTITVQSKAFGLSREEILALRKKGEEFDIPLTAEEALQKGIIHEIVEKFDFLKLPA